MRGNNVAVGYYRDEARDRRGVPGRVVPLRRPRRHASRRLRRDPRPAEGHDHLRRREHLEHRGRARPGRPPGGRRGGRGRRRRTTSGARCRRPTSCCATAPARARTTCASSPAPAWPGTRCRRWSSSSSALPKTATGKVQKHVLRERARARPEARWRVSVRDLFDLTGQAAIVTGGATGLGRQMAERAGRAGRERRRCAGETASAAPRPPQALEQAHGVRCRGVALQRRRRRRRRPARGRGALGRAGASTSW